MSKRNTLRQGKTRGCIETLPVIPYTLTFQLTEDEYAALFSDPALVITVRLNEPLKLNGEEFGWFVHPVKFIPSKNPISLGKQIFCRSEAEAHSERNRLLAALRQQEEDRKRRESERPIPAEVLRTVEVIRGQALRIHAIPISLLPHVADGGVSANELPPDEPFIDIGHAYWQGADGSGQAALAVAKECYEFTKLIRLVRYAQPIRHDGKLFYFGVEFVQCDSQLNALRVLERSIFATEPEAERLFSNRQTDLPRLRARFSPRRGVDRQEHTNGSQIAQLRGLAEKTHDRATKERHLAAIENLQRLHDERRNVEAERAEERRRLQDEQNAAFARLIREYFPNVTAAKSRIKNGADSQLAGYKEHLRRAMRIDCARLGITSPFNNFVVDNSFAREVTTAIKARSPVKPDQVEAVLNWLAKGYWAMPEHEWTSEVSKRINARVSPRGLGETISRKFGLKSKLKGRPETKSDKSTEP